jgi:hypothetical protein
MDSGINEVILQMLGDYQVKVKKKKKDVDGVLSKLEVENFSKYEKGLAEQDLQILTLFRRLIPAVQVRQLQDVVLEGETDTFRLPLILHLVPFGLKA